MSLALTHSLSRSAGTHCLAMDALAKAVVIEAKAACACLPVNSYYGYWFSHWRA